MDPLTALLLIANLLLAAAVLSARIWLTASIEKSIQHDFNQKLEVLRSELRRKEQEVDSELRAKESEIAAIRDGVLGGRTQRQVLLDKRRIEAVERMWASVAELGRYKALSGFLSALNFDAAAKQAERDPEIRQAFKVWLGPYLPTKDQPPNDPAGAERPFVSPLAWAYLSAYRTIVMGSVLQAIVLTSGLKNAREAFNRSHHIQKLLKATLPERADFIDKYELGAYYYLLDEIEEKLTDELKRMLEGAEADQAGLERATQITNAVKEYEKERERQKAEQVGVAAPHQA